MDSNEKTIRNRLAEIDAIISDLNAERSALQGLLYSSAAKSRASEVTNKRSYKRIYNEELIKEAIRSKKGGMIYKDVYIYITKRGIKTKESTVRSYLTRMSMSGQLENDKRTGRWRVIE